MPSNEYENGEKHDITLVLCVFVELRQLQANRQLHQLNTT